MDDERCFYVVLGVEPDAPYTDVKRAFHARSLVLHPDKQCGSPDKSKDRTAKAEDNPEWLAARAAWQCLQNNARRILYNRRRGLTLPKDLVQLLEDRTVLQLLEEQAAVDVSNMARELAQILRREGTNGLVIEEALFGNLALQRSRFAHCDLPQTITGDMLEGPWIDVTAPVQCLVERDHRLPRLLQPGGKAAPRANLPGFFDPCEAQNVDAEVSLYVRYRYRAEIHEVTVGDKEPLKLPQRAHLVRAPRGPCPASNLSVAFQTSPRPERGYPWLALGLVAGAALVAHSEPGRRWLAAASERAAHGQWRGRMTSAFAHTFALTSS